MPETMIAPDLAPMAGVVMDPHIAWAIIACVFALLAAAVQLIINAAPKDTRG